MRTQQGLSRQRPKDILRFLVHGQQSTSVQHQGSIATHGRDYDEVIVVTGRRRPWICMG
jgi:hypothetical protein